MKITADFACLLKKAEQVIKEETKKVYRPLDLMFEMEEKDYDQAIAIYREFGGATRKDDMCEELESLKKGYLNTNYDNLEERIKFLNYTHGWNLNPLIFPNLLQRYLQYKRKLKKQKEISELIKDQYYSTLEYQVLADLNDQVESLICYWLRERMNHNDREFMEERFHHLCNIPSNFSSNLSAASAAA